MSCLQRVAKKSFKYRTELCIATLICTVLLISKYTILSVVTMAELDNFFCKSDKQNFTARQECPRRPIVTVQKCGRLGNQIWEYASVYAVAKATNREGFVPSCIYNRLSNYFVNLSLPTLGDAGHCSIWLPHYANKTTDPKSIDGNIQLSSYAQYYLYVIPILSEIKEIFRFNRDLHEHSQEILRNVSEQSSATVFVGVHVRRTDFRDNLKEVFGVQMVDAGYFLRNMNYFRNKYNSVAFIVASDDPDWCEDNIRASDVVIIRNNTPEQDLALMAACNHSLIDYGTFGMWGAMLSGGETLLYDLNTTCKFSDCKCLETEIPSMLPDWRLVT